MTVIRTALAAAFLGLTAQGAQAVCTGQNLFETMPPERRAAIEEAGRDIPFRRGILYQAQRDDARITLVGTYHFADPRHQPMVDRLAPVIADAAALMVEAGPEEQARLTEALTADPTLMVAPDGPTLRERLSDDDWQALSDAMTDRGTPPVVAARMRPWYVALMLGISPCMVRAMAETGEAGGLDHLLMDQAEATGTPIRALEPWDTMFQLFAGLTPEEELDMIRSSLPAAAYADDYAVTLTDAYFQGDVWTIWEFGRQDAYANSGMERAEVDRQMALAQTRLMDDRNRAWIEPLIEAAEDAGDQGIVAAFGALHLPGEAGVLALLQDRGFAITPLED